MSSRPVLRGPRRARTLLSAAAAVAASGVLLLAPPSHGQSSPVPVSAAFVWPRAQRGSTPAELPDGTAYTPAWFLDVRTSIGTAPSRDRHWLRLVVRKADGSLRQLRRLSTRDDPAFPAVTVSGDAVVWAEAHGDRPPHLWTVNLRDGRPPRQVTADTGQAGFYQSDYDLVIADGRVRWVAAADNEVTEMRSVPLTGGRVQGHGPDGHVAAVGMAVARRRPHLRFRSRLRNIVTGRDLAVQPSRRAVTNCSPHWCRVVSLTGDGFPRIDALRAAARPTSAVPASRLAASLPARAGSGQG